MTSPAEKYGIDVDQWVRSRFSVLNLDGGRGFDTGVRILNCPFCDDNAGKGWVNVLRGRGNCFRANCPINGGIGILEYVQRVDGLDNWRLALDYLKSEFPFDGGDLPGRQQVVTTYRDFCDYPVGLVPLMDSSQTCAEARAFLQTQWGVTGDLSAWEIQVAPRGRYAWRVLVPIVLEGQVVAFQTRTFRNGEPKYLLSKYPTECGRPGEALLFNYDAIPQGEPLVLMEGVGDVINWERRPNVPAHALGLLGIALTEEKAALINLKQPRQIVVALDKDAENRGFQLVRTLQAWGFPVRPGRWHGKDAGSGAELEVIQLPTLRERLQA